MSAKRLPIWILLLSLLSLLSLLQATAQPIRELEKNVQIKADITYATYTTHGKDGKKDRHVKLDLYQPKDRQPGVALPAIVMIHGGAWRMGNRRLCRNHSIALASKGYVTACISYRLRPEVSILECVHDAKAAVRWLRANAATYGIDPNKIGAIGGSAGGHLTAMLATTTDKKLEGKGGNPDTSSAIQAAVGMATPSSLEVFPRQFGLNAEQAKLLSPLRHIDNTDAPTLLLHHPRDFLVPLASSQIMYNKAKEAGADIHFEKIKTGGHAFWHNRVGFKDAMNRAIDFFDKTLKKAP